MQIGTGTAIIATDVKVSGELETPQILFKMTAVVSDRRTIDMIHRRNTQMKKMMAISVAFLVTETYQPFLYFRF